jgi:prohibitin 1
MNKSRVISTAAIAFFVFMILVFISSGAFITIDSGQKGVLFHKFGDGLNKEKVYDQGFHVIAPWNTMFVYNVRIQEQFEQMDVLASNGLAIHIDLSVRYKVVPEKIGYLHDDIGKEYIPTILIPEVRSATRQAIGRYTPEEIYSTKREAIQAEIISGLDTNLQAKYIVLDAVLIRSIELPDKIKQAIERKLEQEQQSQEYEFRLAKEQKEKERKEIEAQGIKQYQQIVSQSLSEQLLKWQGIEATKELANSPNTKVIVVGSGDSGLPLILGGN